MGFYTHSSRSLEGKSWRSGSGYEDKEIFDLHFHLILDFLSLYILFEMGVLERKKAMVFGALPLHYFMSY